MSFKDVIAADISKTFLNPGEFSDMHQIAGRSMPALIDTSENAERQVRFSQSIDGMYACDMTVYVAAADLGQLPARGAMIEIDGRGYTVVNAADESGMYVLALTANGMVGSRAVNIPGRSGRPRIS